MTKNLDPAQGSFFGEGEDKFVPPVQTFEPDPNVVRGRLHGILKTVQSAQTMPWSPRDLRMWKKVFPNMTNWLPIAEATELKEQFSQELARLEI